MALEIAEFYRLHGVEIARVRANSAASFPLHTHAEYVVSANLSGRERIYVDGKRLSATERTVTVYNPEAVQASNFDPDSGDVEFISLYVDPNELVRIAHVNGWLSRATAPELTQGVFSRSELYRHILAAYDAAQTDSQADFEPAMIELVAALLVHSEHCVEGSAPVVALSIEPVIEFMRAHLDAPIGLDRLSGIADVNVFQLIRAFKSAVGMTPAKYHMQLRIKEARQRLRRGLDVQDVAFDLGFYDQSHFINSFKKFVGVSPLRFAAAGRALKTEDPE